MYKNVPFCFSEHAVLDIFFWIWIHFGKRSCILMVPCLLQLGGLWAAEPEWWNVHAGEGRVSPLGHLVQQLQVWSPHVRQTRPHGGCSIHLSRWSKLPLPCKYPVHQNCKWIIPRKLIFGATISKECPKVHVSVHNIAVDAPLIAGRARS